MKKKILIFDTTLRDGEQSPGGSMSIKQKIDFAKQLQALNVDIIEAGFPISSKAQFEACQLITKEVKKPIIAGLARATKGDIDAVYKSLKKAKKPRIHTFIATSQIHMQNKLKKKPKEVLKLAVESVKYAKELVNDVEFSAEDATRSELSFLVDIVSAVIQAGATTINLPDTVGYTTPKEYYTMIKYLKEHCQLKNNTIFSVHCHNDLGLAVSNTIAAIQAGATQAELAINGIGERAGNASLEEVVMILKTRHDLYPFKTNIKIKEIYQTSKLLSQITGIPVQPNKAIVGHNAFLHESGIHQHGMIKNKKTYEIIEPNSIGRSDDPIVLGRHSGKHGIKKALNKLNLKIKETDFQKFYQLFSEISDKKKQLDEEDITTIYEEATNSIRQGYKLNDVSATSGTTPTAKVKITFKKKTYQETSSGKGPIDAVYNAIDKMTQNKMILKEYQLSAIGSGHDTIGNVKVTLSNHKKENFNGNGYSVDIIKASAKAYLNAINLYKQTKGKQ